MPARRSRRARACPSSTRPPLPTRAPCSPALPPPPPPFPAFPAPCPPPSPPAQPAARRPLRPALRRRARCLQQGPAATGPLQHRRRSALRPIRMSAEPILSLRDVSVRLGGSKGLLRKAVPPVQAVRGVSLDLHESEILSLVGGTGCGKTTLRRTILRLQRESGGDIPPPIPTAPGAVNP